MSELASRSEVVFYSGGVSMASTLYRPEASVAPIPCVVWVTVSR